MPISSAFQTDPACRRDSLRSRILMTLAINSGLGFGILAIYTVFEFKEIARTPWTHLFLYQLYGHCTGDLAAFLIPPIAVRLSRYDGWKLWLPYLAVLMLI